MRSLLNPVVHFEIGCTDRDKVAVFYQKLFGWNITDNGISAHVDTQMAKGINGHITSLGHHPNHYITIYIEVDDVGKYVDQVKSLGGEPVAGPLDFADGRQFAWIRDPEGNLVGILSRQ